MKMTDEVVGAIVRLAQEEDPATMRAALDTILGYNRVYPVRFKGELEFLNPLLDLVLEHPEQFGIVKTMIDARRLEAHREIMFPPPPPDKFHRAAAQRTIMQVRRERARRATLIENAMRPERDRLMGHARLEFQRKVLLKWGADLKRQLDEARHGRGGVRLKRPAYDAICDRFWANIDAEMERQEAQLRRDGKPIDTRPPPPPTK